MKNVKIKKPRMPKSMPKSMPKVDSHIKIIMIMLLVFILGFTLYYIYDINKSISTQESFIDEVSRIPMNTQEEGSNKYNIVLIYSGSCGYCTKFMPVFKEVTGKMNVNVEMHLTGSPGATRYMQYVQGVPLTIIEKNSVILSKKAGFMNSVEFESWLSTFVV
jgi:hypothetical protein